jgi:hypothetical protein
MWHPAAEGVHRHLDQGLFRENSWDRVVLLREQTPAPGRPRGLTVVSQNVGFLDTANVSSLRPPAHTSPKTGQTQALPASQNKVR